MAGYSVPQFQFLTAAGAPNTGGSIDIYQTGTTTPVTIYRNGDLSSPAPNPFILDAYGRAEFYVGSTVNLRIDVYDANAGFVETIDPVQPVTDAGGSANSIPLSELIQIPAYTFLGNNTNADGNVSALTAQQIGNDLRGFAGGMSNALRNVQYAIASRGTGNQTIASGTDSYALDGTIVGCTGANIVASQGSTYGMPNGGPTLSNYLAIVGATSNTDVYVYDRVESIDAGRYAGQTCTWQMTITNNTSTVLTPKLTVKYPTVTDNYTSSTTDAVVNAVNLQSINNGGFGTLCWTFACNANASKGIQVLVDFGAMNSNSKNISVTGRNMVVTPGVAVGLNNSPPPLEIPTAEYEQAWNERYLPSFGETTGIIAHGIASSATSGSMQIKLNTKTRIAVSALTVTTVGDFQALLVSGGNLAALSSLTFINASRNMVMCGFTVASGLNSGSYYPISVTSALAGNLIFTGAEL